MPDASTSHGPEFDPLCLAGVRVLDVSRRLDRCAPYPGDPEYQRTVVSGPGDPALSRLTLCAHSGTHVDAPSHVLPEGASLGGLETNGRGLGRFVLPALVVQMAGEGGLVAREELERALEEAMGAMTARPTSAPLDGTLLTGTAVLLRTPNSANPRLARGEFDPAYTALSPDAARLLAGLDAALVGVDGPGVDPYEISAEYAMQRVDDGRADRGQGGHGGAAPDKADPDPADPGQTVHDQRAPGQAALDQADPDQDNPDQDAPGLAAHHVLLGAGIPLLENLDLSGVEPGLYGLVCLPLSLDPGAEASPVRAVLLATK